MKLQSVFLLLYIFCQHLYSQTSDSLNRADCQIARTIVLENKITKVKGSPLKEFGDISEINFNPYPYAFKKEHHTAWYQLKIKSSGWLTFDIIPFQTKDDYDFMLFKADSLHACDLIQNAKIKPIRAIISRNDLKLKSKTGLDSLSNKRFDDEGVGSSYSKHIKVNAGEIYYLVVDNVYNGGKGHDIVFKIRQLKSYRIKVKDTDSNQVKVDFTIRDAKGKVIKKIEPNTEGDYLFEPYQFGDYFVHIGQTGYFTKVFSAKQTAFELNEDYELVVQPLEAGATYVLNNILFEGNQAIIIKESNSTVIGLIDMMKINPTLKIEIQGHVNESPENKELSTFKLSENRAKRIYEVLVSKGINANRLSWKGFGGEFPIYKEYVDETYCKFNRRVEIKVISK
jgi:outer membrane protein OmpA-like peptidoglycan-associated protein